MDRLTPPFLARLPIHVLNLWSVVDYLDVYCASDIAKQKRELTVELIVSLLEQEYSRFCGKLACRFCLRSLKASHPPADIAHLLVYIKLWLNYVRNDGADAHTAIPNTFVSTKMFIPLEENVCKAIALKGGLPTFTPPSPDPKGPTCTK
jgi:hypothetical protein